MKLKSYIRETLEGLKKLDLDAMRDQAAREAEAGR